MRDNGLMLAAVAGLVAHFVFNKYEAVAAQPSSLFILLVIVPSLSTPFHTSVSNVLTEAALSYAVFYVTLICSIVLYRVSPFHPLAKYPGPQLCKVSKLWNLWIASGGKYHEYVKNLHDQYGAYVRVGPNELSFVDVDAISPIMGADGMPKGPLFDGRHKPGVLPNLLCVRDRSEHTRRRKRWDKAFTTSAVKDYEGIAIQRALTLVEELEKRTNGQSVDLAQWMSFFAFDFMGDMVFGGGFELMREGDKDGVWHMLEKGMRDIALLGNIPWFSGIFFGLRSLRPPTKSAEGIRNFAVRCVSSRKEKGPVTKDIFHYLVEEAATPPPFSEVISDAGLSIIAGSDTTATTLSNVFYYVLSNPDTYQHLREEVDKTFPLGEGDAVDSQKLTQMPYLNAVINEAMRLQPVVPSGSQRAPTQATGDKLVGSHYIREGTAISVPTYAIHRDRRYFFPHPDRFIPERWLGSKLSQSEPLEKSDYVTNHTAFVPFSYGPASCVGKSLAMVEMRMIVALLTQRFDVRLADGFSAEEWEKSLVDMFVLSKGCLPVVLSTRDD